MSSRLVFLLSLLVAYASVSAQTVPAPTVPDQTVPAPSVAAPREQTGKQQNQDKIKSDQSDKGQEQEGIAAEDWAKLSIRGLGWQSLPPLPGGTVERPEFTREYIRLEWRRGDPVDVFVVLPHGIKKPQVILYLYGYPNDLSRFTNDAWCKGATENGFAAVGFVSALTGERYRGDRPMKEWFVSELQESLGSTTHDVQMILNYLEQRGDLNTDHLGMYAQGSGASIAILAASVESRIAVLDLLNPWGDWPDWLKESPLVPEKERAAYLRPEFLEKVDGLDPMRILPKLTQVVRLQQVGDDTITPALARHRIAAAVPRGAQVLQSENWAAYRKAWQDKKLWNWAKEQLEHSPTSVTAQTSMGR